MLPLHTQVEFPHPAGGKELIIRVNGEGASYRVFENGNYNPDWTSVQGCCPITSGRAVFLFTIGASGANIAYSRSDMVAFLESNLDPQGSMINNADFNDGRVFAGEACGNGCWLWKISSSANSGSHTTILKSLKLHDWN